MRLVGMALLLVALVSSAACRPPGYGKGGDATDGDDSTAMVDATGTEPDAAPGTDGRAPDAASGAACTQTFTLTGHNTAGSVWLTGDFTGWATNPGAGAIELAIDPGGTWSIAHDFEAGTYTYKFIVDSTTWILDPGNPETMDDGMGNTNSVYRCTP